MEVHAGLIMEVPLAFAQKDTLGKTVKKVSAQIFNNCCIYIKHVNETWFMNKLYQE